MSLSGDLARRVAEVKARAGLAEVIGRTVKLRRTGREQTGLCPFHNESSPSFTVVPEKGFAHCFGCGWHGDVIRFVQDSRGLDFIAALAEMEAELGLGPGLPEGTRPAPVQRQSLRQDAPDTGLVSSMEAAVAIWRGGHDAHKTIVARYLQGRGIDPDATRVLDVVRFHPACPIRLWRRGEDPAAARLTAPAMLAPICVVDQAAGQWRQIGLHVTFLASDGSGKARLPSWTDRRTGEVHDRPSRKIFGEAAGGCVPVPPYYAITHWRSQHWLGGEGELIVGEGLESSLSLAQRIGAPRGVLATLTLNNLQGSLDQGNWRKVPAHDGLPGGLAMPLFDLKPDLARPPFVLRDAGPVAIGIDADMKGLKPRWVLERPRGRPVWRAITGAERSDICAALAALHWRAAGASKVRVLRPSAGRDFNDEARSVVNG